MHDLTNNKFQVSLVVHSHSSLFFWACQPHPHIWCSVCRCGFVLSSFYVMLQSIRDNSIYKSVTWQNKTLWEKKIIIGSQSLFALSNYKGFTSSVLSHVSITHTPSEQSRTRLPRRFIHYFTSRVRRSVSRCHAKGISAQIPHGENYSDAFRCPLGRALWVLLGAEGEAKWMWQA